MCPEGDALETDLPAKMVVPFQALLYCTELSLVAERHPSSNVLDVSGNRDTSAIQHIPELLLYHLCKM